MKPSKYRVALLHASDDPAIPTVRALLEPWALSVDTFSGGWGSPFPDDIIGFGDPPTVILSYRSRWIVPDAVLSAAAAAYNIHPGPPSRRGIGALNWALYEGDQHYGVTLHRMAARVDAGEIMDVAFFPVAPDDTVMSLTVRTYALMLAMLAQNARSIVWHQVPLGPFPSKWTGGLRTRRDLDELATITLGMSEAEAKRRIRATHYPPCWPTRLKIGDAVMPLTGLTNNGSKTA